MTYLAQVFNASEGWTTVAERKSVKGAVSALATRGVPEARYGYLARNTPESSARWALTVYAELKRDHAVVGRVVG